MTAHTIAHPFFAKGDRPKKHGSYIISPPNTEGYAISGVRDAVAWAVRDNQGRIVRPQKVRTAKDYARLLDTVIGMAPAFANDDVAQAVRLKAEAVERGFRRHSELLRGAGGVLSAEEVARLTEFSKPSVLERAAKGIWLGLRSAKQHAVLFPLFQFADTEDHLLPGLAEVLAVLNEVPAIDAWAKCNFLLSERSSLKGASPLDLLKQGSVRRVVALAKAYAS